MGCPRFRFLKPGSSLFVLSFPPMRWGCPRFWFSNLGLAFVFFLLVECPRFRFLKPESSLFHLFNKREKQQTQDPGLQTKPGAPHPCRFTPSSSGSAAVIFSPRCHVNTFNSRATRQNRKPWDSRAGAFSEIGGRPEARAGCESEQPSSKKCRASRKAHHRRQRRVLLHLRVRG